MSKSLKLKSKSKDKPPKDKHARDKSKKPKRASAIDTDADVDGDEKASPDSTELAVSVSRRPRAVRKTTLRKKPARKTAMRRTPAPRSRAAPDETDTTPLTDRVVNAIESELNMIEKIVGRSGAGPGQRTEAERRARTLASLARTLSELKKMQSVEPPTKAADDRVAAGDDEAFRLDLARRLGITVAEAKTVHPDEEPSV